MARRRTLASRWAAVATWALALVLLWQALHAESNGARVLEGAVALAAVVGATKLWLHNCFESHLVVIGVVIATVLGSVLSLTLGMPGGSVTPLAPLHVIVLGLAIAIGTLLFADARTRRAAG